MYFSSWSITCFQQVINLNKNHGSTIKHMTNIICNLPIDSLNFLYNPNSINLITTKQMSDKSISNNPENTAIMACLIKNNKTTLVIPPNTLHLLQ